MELPRFRLSQLGFGAHRAFELSTADMLLPAGTTVVGRLCEQWHAVANNTPCITVSQGAGIQFGRLWWQGGPATSDLWLHYDNCAIEPTEVLLNSLLEVWEVVAKIAATPAPSSREMLADLSKMHRDVASGIASL